MRLRGGEVITAALRCSALMRSAKTIRSLGLAVGLMFPIPAATAAPASSPEVDAEVSLAEPVSGPVALSWGRGRLTRKDGALVLGVDEVSVSIRNLSGAAHVRCWAYGLRTIFGTTFTTALGQLEVEELRDGTATGERQVIKPTSGSGSWFEWVADASEPGDYTYRLSSSSLVGVHSCLVTSL